MSFSLSLIAIGKPSFSLQQACLLHALHRLHHKYLLHQSYASLISARPCSCISMHESFLYTHRNNTVTLHTILIGVAGTIYNPYTIDPLCNLGLTKEKAHTTANKLHFHAVKALTKVDNTKNALLFSNLGNGGSGVGGMERAACRRARRTPGRMADNPPDPH